ncbi:hypothetical protein ACLKA6_003822 [Drosophila palustris]
MSAENDGRPSPSFMAKAVPTGEDRGKFWRWKPENNVLKTTSVMATCPSCDTRQQTIVNKYTSNKGHRFTHTCPACSAIIGTYES